MNEALDPETQTRIAKARKSYTGNGLTHGQFEES